MAYTIANLITESYEEAGVSTGGIPLSSKQLRYGNRALNLILDEVYTKNQIHTTITLAAVFDGRSNYTIGPNPEFAGDPVPDIVVDTPPIKLQEIVVNAGGNSRQSIGNIDPITYSSRPVDNISTQYPAGFFYERTHPLSTIKFYEGTPSGPAEIVFKKSLVDVTPNTSYEGFPKSIRPYLVYALAERIMEHNTFDGSSMARRASQAWKDYRASNYEGRPYIVDGSCPNSYSGEGNGNILNGWRT